jgi:hypothetical protein
VAAVLKVAVPLDQVGYVVCHCPLSYEVVEMEAEDVTRVKDDMYEVLRVEVVLAETEGVLLVVEVVIMGVETFSGVAFVLEAEVCEGFVNV